MPRVRTYRNQNFPYNDLSCCFRVQIHKSSFITYTIRRFTSCGTTQNVQYLFAFFLLFSFFTNDFRSYTYRRHRRALYVANEPGRPSAIFSLKNNFIYLHYYTMDEYITYYLLFKDVFLFAKKYTLLRL